jgi:hypothetical protein
MRFEPGRAFASWKLSPSAKTRRAAGFADGQRHPFQRLAAVIGRQHLAVAGKEAGLFQMQVGDQQRLFARPVQRAARHQPQFLAGEGEKGTIGVGERNGNHGFPLPQARSPAWQAGRDP